MSDEEDALLDETKDQDQIRLELSQMSFEDLQKLKEKLGTKVYNETLFGPRKVKKTEFKRENKNRPREISAKRPVSRFREIIHAKKNIPRDPRFDSLCGTFKEKEFKKAYGFLSDVKENDVKKLKKELEETEDPKMIKKIKYLIQRLENQIREEKKRDNREEKISQEKKEVVEAIKRGEKPVFKKKSEKKVLNLVSQYEELKNSGKLTKHIQRLRKRNLHKDRQKLAPSMME
ncbi:PREDICTED: ribosomal RNA processing protein 36 homolog [Dufourea novaeangliae]|uniref:rRNA biogenesis protein RRP36 n=1 Tax=Dufourea novaeangliae TaxID=178035 RepID=A0A154P3R8_DUFNO|nr:PREDICTED: ribosomal RNA processing protein 36 homolog [Dufourea novaeangliae]XP_015440080.1 PREDICTED: ribosomal RNA processing protein 36 homolog [Dufourea novaeangliae]KZC06497.1 Ribosomal RNA processing protein 36 like protein [Dufourea novaeangliae]